MNKHLWELSVGTDEIGEPNCFYVSATDAEMSELAAIERANCLYHRTKMICRKLAGDVGSVDRGLINTAADMREEMQDLGYDMAVLAAA